MIDEDIFKDMQRQEALQLEKISNLIKEKKYILAITELKRLSDMKKFRTEELLVKMGVE